MDQMTQQFMSELQEFVHKAQRFLQEAGGNYGQRGYYGMREGGGTGGSSGGSSGGGGGSSSYGQREMPWMNQGMQGMQGQGWQQPNQGWGGGGNFPNIDPRYFM